MYSFLVQSNNVAARLAATVEAKIQPKSKYQWFTYDGSKPVQLDFRGKPVTIETGDRFGVRPSANGKFIRLIRPGEETKVHTISIDQAKKLAKGIRAEGR